MWFTKAEEPLPAYGSCLLSSLNLAAFVTKEEGTRPRFDIVDFKKAVEIVTREMHRIMMEGMPLHPLNQQSKCVYDWRQMGIGIMGLADMLIEMGIRYGSHGAVSLCDEIGECMAQVAMQTSNKIAREDGAGVYPMGHADLIANSPFYKQHFGNDEQCAELAHSQLLTIAPTGSISTLLGISGGIEPIFANYYTRRTESIGKDTYKVYTPIVRRYMEKHHLTDDSQLPDYFVCSADIPVKERIAMQAVWQKHIDASISSTVNLPETATVDDVMNLYIDAWRAGLKGITVFRSGCRRAGILVASSTNTNAETKPVTEPLGASDELPRGYIEEVPEGLTYRKFKLHTGCGKLYLFIGVDEDEGKIYDFFTNTDGVGGCSINTQANSRLLSACIRGGVPINYVLDQLQKSGTCPSYQYARGQKRNVSRGKSCPSAIAYAIQDLLAKLKENNQIDEEVEITPEDTEVISSRSTPIVDTGDSCPECKSTDLTHEGGCIICRHCGWSKCS